MLVAIGIQAGGFGGNVRRVEVLGDLTRNEALVYVRGGNEGDDEMWPDPRSQSEKLWAGILSQSDDAPKLEEKDWDEVWSVCGGNVLLIQACVREAIATGSWVSGEKSASCLYYSNTIFNQQ